MSDRTPTRPPARHRRRPLAALSTAAIAAMAATTVVVPAAPTVAGPVSVVIDDFDDGDTSDWIFFGGNAAGGGGGPAEDRPQAGTHYLSTGWGGEGSTSGFYGGTFRNFANDAQVVPPVDPWLNVWVLNQSNATVDAYTLEITLREDLDGNGWTNGDEDSILLATTFDAGDFDDRWTLVSAPLSSFTNAGTGGNGTFDGALDEIVVGVAGVQGASGSTVELDLDELAFTSGTAIPIDDFESGVLPGESCPAGGLPLGVCTFSDPNSSVSVATTATPPVAVPGAATSNQVLRMDADVVSFAGFIHGFTNAAMDTWVPQDWSASQGISFWMYGTGSGTPMFVDVLDNRNPGSTGDDAERWSAPFVDDFTGWRSLEFPFSSFARKEIGNGAPNDGFGLFEVHGYAIGTVTTPAPLTIFVDDVHLYGVGEPAPLAVQLSQQNTFVTEGTTGEVGVRLNRPLGVDDPAQVSIDYATERSNAVPGEEFVATSGTLTFVQGGPSELFFPVETFDDTKFEGDEQIVIRLTDPVDVERGTLFQGSVLIDDDDPYDPDLLDDFERGAYLWDTQGGASIEAVRTEAGTADARPGQDAVEQVGVAQVPIAIDVEIEGATCPRGRAVVPVHILSTPDFDATNIDHTTVRLGAASETHVDRRTGDALRHVDDVDGDGLDDLVFHFRFDETGLSCDLAVWPVTGETFDGQMVSSAPALVRDFPLAQDWTDTERLDFWYHGTGGGDEITVTLKDNRAPDPGPAGWTLAWADEFDDPAGTAPNGSNWAYELGDTTPDGKNGWGNEELQYYTDDPEHAATDGAGNLVITLDEADEGRECYYGPCQFESARLITQHKAEFAYGRIESRLRVPEGGPGLWPAFWSLGTDITYNPWPGAGEIDIMEYVSRIPNEIFGTVHGPGYSGGASIGDIYDFGEQRVDEAYHTYAVEWQPNLIVWYIDGVEYHRVTPADLPGPWVFDKPFFLLLNFAIGGNFGGAVDPANTYPQEYLVDYVRVFQGPDTAERFEASFVDTTAGWQRVSIPVTDFVRSADQPAGAPDDGLGLDEVWGYGFAFPNGTTSGEARFDLVERVPVPPPTELVVTTLADGGPGSLREALALIADGGTITFDPALAGGTIALTSGQLVAGRSVTIDGPDAGMTISGSGESRVLLVPAGVTVHADDLVVADGAGSPQGGGVQNLGALHLERVVVRDNVVPNTAATAFDRGGGGIYNGEGATMTLTDSTVSGNTTANQPGGGIYGFFGSQMTITRSTISGNTSGDVAGGVRSLGNLTITESTVSGNVSAVFHGGGLWLTDGVVTISGSTIVDNDVLDGTAGGVMVASFGAPVAVTIQNSIVAGNGAYDCQVEGGVSATLTSLGGNVFGDDSCGATAGDQTFTDPLVGPLADNGGPTFTHALSPTSPAVDGADAGSCSATDQRGVPRPQGAGCDAGSFELVP